MRRFLLSGLRIRVALLVLLTIFPATLLQMYQYVEQRRQISAEAYETALRVARNAATEQNRLLEDTRQLLAALALHPELKALDRTDCGRILAGLMGPNFTNLGAATLEGNVVCSAVPPTVPVNIADRAYFTRAIASRSFAVGEYQIGRITGKPAVNAGYPVTDERGRITAVVYAAIDLGWLNKAAAQAMLPPGSTVTVFDDGGTVLARSPDPERWVGHSIAESPLLKAVQVRQTEGTFQAVGLDGTPRLHAFATLPGSGGRVYVSVGIPTAVAFGALARTFAGSLSAIVVVGLTALAVAWVGSRSLILRPVDRLVEAARRLRTGDLSARAGIPERIGELGQLAQAFDEMAESIALREQRITRQLETLTVLYAGAQKLTQRLDLHWLAQEIVRTYVDVFGGRLAWLGRALPDGTVRILAVHPQPEPQEFPPHASVRWDDSPEGRGPAGRAIRKGFPDVSNLAGDAVPRPWREALLARGIRSAGSFPLISRDTPVGVVGVFSDDPGFFTPERVEMLQAYANQAAAALENARLFSETERRLQQLGALRTIDMAITASLDLRVTLGVLLGQVTTQLGVDAADVLLLNPQAQTLEYAAGRGFRSDAFARSRLRLGEGHAGVAAQERRVVKVPNLADAREAFVRATLIHGEGFVSYYAAPLIAKGQVKGVLETLHRASLDPDAEWFAFFEAVAGQAAIAIDNAGLYDDLQRSNAELALAYDTTLEGWSKALDLRDKETEGHTLRVTELTVRLATAMGVKEDALIHIRRGALLHDIGKMGVPDGILLKPGALTDEEWVIMRKHPVHAFELLSPIPYLRPALDIPYAHHEKWDGTGYPRGLKGEQIPLAARIFAVVDVWDALTSDRPYRPAWSETKARAYIREHAGKHFDPRVVEAFIALDAEALLIGPGGSRKAAEQVPRR